MASYSSGCSYSSGRSYSSPTTYRSTYSSPSISKSPSMPVTRTATAAPATPKFTTVSRPYSMTPARVVEYRTYIRTAPQVYPVYHSGPDMNWIYWWMMFHSQQQQVQVQTTTGTPGWAPEPAKPGISGSAVVAVVLVCLMAMILFGWVCSRDEY